MFLAPAGQVQAQETFRLQIGTNAPPMSGPYNGNVYNAAAVTVAPGGTTIMPANTIVIGTGNTLSFSANASIDAGNDLISFGGGNVTSKGTGLGSTPVYIVLTVRNYTGTVTSFATDLGITGAVVKSTYSGYSTVLGTSDYSQGLNITNNSGAVNNQGAAYNVTNPTGSTIVLTLELTNFLSPTQNTNPKGGPPSISANVSLVSAVPEPNAMLIGLLGLPCMGAVVYFARRRSTAMAAMVA